MARKKSRRDGPQPDNNSRGQLPAADPPASPFPGRFAAWIAGTIFGRFIRLYAAFFLGIAGVFLIIAWQAAPQRALDAAKYANFTARAEGTIVENWLAIEWNPADMGDLLNWHAFARTLPCAVVEYAGDWGAPARRAFCGNRFSFRTEHTLHDIAEMAPGVPFGWARDGRGFIVPEIRVDHIGLKWLETHPPYSTFMLGKPPPATALEALQFQVNRPVDEAVASWSIAPPRFELAVDPRQPADAMPAKYVESRRSFDPLSWLMFLLTAIPGIALWLSGMGILLPSVPPLARRLLSVLPLLTLPWWSEQFPNVLRSVSKDLASIVADVVGDIDRTERLIGSDPAQATLAGGERLVFPVGQHAYAATFGRFHFAQPDPPPASADAALAALTQTITVQARALSQPDQADLFAQLTRDKTNDRRGAGMVFLPAAKEALQDTRSDPALRAAARRFLSNWVTQPIEEPRQGDPAFRERVRLFTELAEIPIPEIWIMAKSVVERAQGRM